MWFDGHFLCMGEYGQLTLLKVNPDKYEPLAVVDYADPVLGGQLLNGADAPLLKPYCWAAPVVSHGLLYLRGDGRLACFELITQK
jgi:hypothetical protein